MIDREIESRAKELWAIFVKAPLTDWKIISELWGAEPKSKKDFMLIAIHVEKLIVRAEINGIHEGWAAESHTDKRMKELNSRLAELEERSHND